MGCIFRARLNSLTSIWYTLLVLAVQTYLLHLGFERYKLYNEMKWPVYPHTWLTVYVTLYAVCVPTSLLFFAFGFFKSGNIAGDNEKIADREERVIEVSRNRKGEKTGCIHRLKNIWQHSPPMPQQIHIIMAICQLVAQQVMIAQLYRQGFINPGDFLNTEMDFLYQRSRQLATNLPMGDSRLQGFRLTADELSASPLAPNILPLLMHFRLFGISLEFVNFFIALIAYSCVYPAVFWRVNKVFSLLFTFHLFIFSASMMWSYMGFSILFRILETNQNQLRPVGLGQHLVTSRQFPLYHPYAIIGTYALTVFVTFLAPISLYSYGFNKYLVSLMNLQAKSNIRSGGSTGDYGDLRKKSYGRSPSQQLCCDGYGSHALAIVLLVILIILKAPTIYALLILYQHDEKPLLLTAIVVDVVYLFTWVLLWILLTMKREWEFNVAHHVHQIFSLQKGGATGHIKGNENPSQLKNALIVMHKDHMFVTDDQAAKQSLLRHVQRGHFDATDDVCWNKRNGAHNQSPTRRLDECGTKGTPEMTRMMRGPSDDPSVSYHSMRGPQPQLSMSMRGNSSPPEEYRNNMGTLQRSQQANYPLQRGESGTLQRSIPPNSQWPTQQEAYASIHKGSKDPVAAMYQRRGSNDGPTYGHIENTYSNYGTYARLPTQTRIPVQPGQPVNSLRINGNNYAAIPQRRPSDQTSQAIGGVRQSPQLSERMPPIPATSSGTLTKPDSQYQRSALKMSSFNAADKAGGGAGGGAYGTTGTQWGSQRAPPGQPQQLLWNQNKPPTMSASSSQQDACFTPTSTLTSQGSNYSSQHTPTAGSPQTVAPLYSRTNGAAPIYGQMGDTLGTIKTRPVISTGSTSVRHTVKLVGPRTDDSANFSIASSAGSAEASNNSDFATSIV